MILFLKLSRCNICGTVEILITPKKITVNVQNTVIRVEQNKQMSDL